MIVLSVLRRVPGTLNGSLNLARWVKLGPSARAMSDHGPRIMDITPSRWQWHKFKDMLHFYVMLGLIPLGAVTFLTNVFVGPAQLGPIPEGYRPQNHEYHSHPVTRFFCRYIHHDYQQDYEKKLHKVHVIDEEAQMRLLESKIKRLLREKSDVQGYAYNPLLTKYHKRIRMEHDRLKHDYGDT